VRLPWEIRTVWALLGASLVAVLVTYSRLPPEQLYSVSGSGVEGGLSRVLVELNFPDALAALAVLGVVAARIPVRLRPVAAVAALLCAVVAWPGVVSQNDLDARWINAVPALGTLLALALSLVARGPWSRAGVRGDGLRAGIAAVLVLLAAPWIAATLGFYLDGVPVLDRIFQTGKLVSFGDPLHHAVHHGVHHGLQGMLLALTALLLSRLLGSVAGSLRVLVGVYLAVMLAYGIGNMTNDGWLEQVAERGWTSHLFPSVLEPAVSWGWLAVVLVAAAVWLLWFGASARPAGRRPIGQVPG
jgi:hypothetical protein